jgi:hypothetical protein
MGSERHGAADAAAVVADGYGHDHGIGAGKAEGPLRTTETKIGDVVQRGLADSDDGLSVPFCQPYSTVC